ncbi:Fc.00g065300.m01.CDS01 [Cosmosporella sp. VM-42]
MNPHQQNHASMPFWDFIQSLDPNQGPGRGVDYNTPGFGPFPGGPPPHGPHGAGFEWGPWTQGPGGPWGHHGRRGHHGHGRFHRGGTNAGESREDAGNTSGSDGERDAQQEKRDSTETMGAEVPDPAEVAPEEDERPHGRRGCGRGRGGLGGRGHRGGCGRGRGRGGFFHGHFGPHHGPGAFPGAYAPPPYPGSEGASPFDFGGFLRGWAGHPFFRNLREQAQHFQTAQPENEDSFAPPVDIFNTESAFILHVALPGAKKDDIGVNWDEDSGILNIAGVVHRPGDEDFLNTLSSAERKVGMFERNVPLPPSGSPARDEIDGLNITAKMEDGVLIITVPKVEKEWTEIRKVDIE